MSPGGLIYLTGVIMIAIIGRLGDQLLGLLVPSINVDAAGAAACFNRLCYCRNRQARYQTCCNGSCGGCNLLLDC